MPLKALLNKAQEMSPEPEVTADVQREVLNLTLLPFQTMSATALDPHPPLLPPAPTPTPPLGPHSGAQSRLSVHGAERQADQEGRAEFALQCARVQGLSCVPTSDAKTGPEHAAQCPTRAELVNKPSSDPVTGPTRVTGGLSPLSQHHD